MKTFKDLKAELLQNPEVRTEYERLRPEFELTNTILSKATMTPQQAHDIQRCLVCAPVDCACEGSCFRNARRLLFLEQQIEHLREKLAAHCIDGDEIADYAPSWEVTDWGAS